MKRDKKTSAGNKYQITTWPLYILLVAVFILYIVFQSITSLAIIFGIAAFFLIVFLVGVEFVNGSRESGKIRNIVEVVVAIVVVIGVWFLLRVILHTSYPLDAVPSCSMLPYLHRGDMIVLQGANPSQIKAPIVNVSETELQDMIKNINNESLECVAYQQIGRNINISQIVLPGYSIGLYKPTETGGEIIPYSQQGSNLVKYQCGEANDLLSTGKVVEEAYTTSITIANTTITGDHNNSIVVYQTVPQDSFFKDGDSYVVHRVYAIINANGSYYFLTKGDNNPGLDMQYENLPANQSNIEGKVIATIPYIGYLKLILSGTISQPEGCNSTLED